MSRRRQSTVPDSTDTGPDLCPACGYFVEAATPMPGTGTVGTPDPGDLTVCLSCGAVLTWDADMYLCLMPTVGLELPPVVLLARQHILARGPIVKKVGRA